MSQENPGEETLPKTEVKETSTIKDIDVDGFKFQIDTDDIDDVETLEVVERIEHHKQISAVIPLLTILIGKEKYKEMKEYFVKKDGKFKASKLNVIYAALVEALDPKDLPSSK